MKKLYFTDDFSEENIAKLQGQGYILRDVRAYHDGDTIEECDEAHGNIPEAYADKAVIEAIDVNDMTVEQLKVLLDGNGIEFDGNAKKADLVELAQAIQ